MEKKWCLIKESDGARGAAGKKKIYEVTVAPAGDGYSVTFSWGMAEKVTRQTKTLKLWHAGYALQTAQQQVNTKLAGGYSLAYVV
jgi:hypothetical protein